MALNEQLNQIIETKEIYSEKIETRRYFNKELLDRLNIVKYRNLIENYSSISFKYGTGIKLNDEQKQKFYENFLKSVLGNYSEEEAKEIFEDYYGEDVIIDLHKLYFYDDIIEEFLQNLEMLVNYGIIKGDFEINNYISLYADEDHEDGKEIMLNRENGKIYILQYKTGKMLEIAENFDEFIDKIENLKK